VSTSAWCSALLALLLALLLVGPAAAQEKRSGYDDAGPQVRAMQDDDMANPAFLWVQQGAALWDRAEGEAGRSCAACHGPVASLRGVAARHPAYDAARGRVVTLAQRVNLCRTERQAAPALAPESDALLGITALVGLQSRGMPVAVDVSGPAAAAAARGEAFHRLRQGQLNLSCAQCHDGLAGQSLAGSRIPQGHANAYPIYRLEWQAVGSLFRRLRACLVGVRAEPLERDDPVLADLELYLAKRAAGLRVETPGVRP
jgi:L-cysteine S-thiosulfotransferase